MHVSADLSAYLDGELAPAERARVSAHLEACGRCAGQLADLRATATLMAALPDLRPSRSLVPSVARRWNWLRPLRSLSAVTSGAFLMVFLIASVAQSGSDLGGGPPVPFGGAGQAAPGAAPAAGTQTPERAAAPAELQAATAAPAETESTAFSTETGAAEDAAAREADRSEQMRTAQGQAPPPSPLIWLGLSLIAAALAFTAHWRLRTG